MSVRLLSWNVAARVGRWPERIDAIAELEPDVVAFQEVTQANLAEARAGLQRLGLDHSVNSFELAPDTSVLIGKRRYGELLASRWPLAALSPERCGGPRPERVLSATLDCPHIGSALEIHTAHIPPGVSNGWVKIEVLEAIDAMLACSSSVPRILCGDFNTPKTESADGSVVTWGKPGGRWDPGERNVIVGLKEFDLPDVFRQINGYDAEQFSWYWGKGSHRVGRRFDHVFASAALGATECRYIHDVRERGLSDHSAILAVFSPSGQARPRAG
jgi:exonuclease III